MLTVITWMWGDKFGPDYVAKLAAGVRRNLKRPHRFLCITDEDLSSIGIETTIIKDPGLAKMKGCFCRLRMFDPEWQQDIGIDTDGLVNIDLDTVITGPLDPLFNRQEPFMIMQGGNAVNPCPYNGALIMLRPGVHSQVWSEFTLQRARAAPFHKFPDDQGWIYQVVPLASGWKCGNGSGVYVYQKPGWPGGKSATKLPQDARLVTFINRDPKDLMHLDWVKQNWVT